MPALPSSPDDLLAAATLEAEGFLSRPRKTLTGELGPETTDAAVQRLGRDAAVELMGTLGVGGMAVVHLGRQASMDREVAVKTLRADQHQPEARQRLLREAWITGRLEHPNIVPVHDVRTDADGAPQILLKRIEGESWATLLAEPERLAPRLGGQDPLAWHLRVLIATCNAADFAHSRGVVHRDIKPENVMLGAFGEVTLLDWGVAARVGPEGVVRSPKGEGRIVGTPAYMAPELVGRNPHGPFTDVYLLGAVLFELLAGRPPHQGDTLAEMLASMLREPDLPDSAPPPLAILCRQAMSPETRRRPTVSELRQALERFLDQRATAEVFSAAETQLAALRDAIVREADEAEVIEHLSSARFGFEQVLRAWPEHPGIRQRLDDCAHVAARWALAQGRPALADYHLRMAERAEPALRDAVRQALRAQQEQEAALEGLRREQDPSVGHGLRQRAAAAMFTLAGVFGLLLTLTRPGYLSFAATSLIIAAVGLYFLRAAALQGVRTRYNHQLMVLIAVIPLSQTLVDLGGWLRGWPPEVSHSVVIVLVMTATATMAASADRRLGWLALIWALGWLLASTVPGPPYWIFVVAAAISLGVTFLIWREEAPPRERE